MGIEEEPAGGGGRVIFFVEHQWVKKGGPPG